MGYGRIQKLFTSSLEWGSAELHKSHLQKCLSQGFCLFIRMGFSRDGIYTELHKSHLQKCLFQDYCIALHFFADEIPYCARLQSLVLTQQNYFYYSHLLCFLILIIITYTQISYMPSFFIQPTPKLHITWTQLCYCYLLLVCEQHTRKWDLKFILAYVSHFKIQLFYQFLNYFLFLPLINDRYNDILFNDFFMYSVLLFCQLFLKVN